MSLGEHTSVTNSRHMFRPYQGRNLFRLFTLPKYFVIHGTRSMITTYSLMGFGSQNVGGKIIQESKILNP